MKICNHCKAERPIEMFNKLISSPDGHQLRCKECDAVYRENSREHIREMARLYRISHREACRASSRASARKYREKNREKVLETKRNYARRFRKENPELAHKKDRKLALMKNYGITESEYDRRLADQGGVCEICGQKYSTSKRGYLCVDHDHKTGSVRGLLCHKCNVALGAIDDSLEVLEKMMRYVGKYRLLQES